MNTVFHIIPLTDKDCSNITLLEGIRIREVALLSTTTVWNMIIPKVYLLYGRFQKIGVFPPNHPF